MPRAASGGSGSEAAERDEVAAKAFVGGRGWPRRPVRSTYHTRARGRFGKIGEKMANKIILALCAAFLLSSAPALADDDRREHRRGDSHWQHGHDGTHGKHWDRDRGKHTKHWKKQGRGHGKTKTGTESAREIVRPHV